MKRLFCVLSIAIIALASCNKEEGPAYQLEGRQWISQEMTDETIMVDYRVLLDVGYTSDGEATLAKVVSRDDDMDIIINSQSAYTYDQNTGAFTMMDVDAKIEFLNEKTFKLNTSEKILTFTLAEMEYDLNSTTEEPEEPEGFKIYPDKDSDYAGGTIEFTANQEVKEWNYELVLPDGVTQSQIAQTASCPTTLSSGVLKLSCYRKDLELYDAQINVTATAVSGETAEYTVTSKAWEVGLFDYKADFAPVKKSDIYCGMSIGFAPYTTEGNIKEWYDNKSFKWEHNCLSPFGNVGDCVCADVLSTSQISTSSSITDKDAPYYIKVTYRYYSDTAILREENLVK